MVESLNKPELETLDCEHNWAEKGSKEVCIHCGAETVEQPASDFRLQQPRVIKPEMRANKGEDAGQAPHPCNYVNQQRLTEQPNLKIIEEIEGLISQVNEKIHKLIFTHKAANITRKQTLWLQALEEIDLFQKTTLFELRRSFE